jgi:hypothetical protein
MRASLIALSALLFFLSPAPAQAAPPATHVYHCTLAGSPREFLVLFNVTPIRHAKAAVMGGMARGDFHPLYGVTRFVWEGDTLSMTFEDTVPIADWTHEPLVDDCYTTSHGGYYIFDKLVLGADGVLNGKFRDPDKLERAPGKTCDLSDPNAPTYDVSCKPAPDTRL